MLRLLAGRIIAVVPVIGILLLLVFLLLRLTPGDPAAIIAGEAATPAQIAAIHARLGLDQPIWQQFIDWLAQLAHGDLGNSVFSGLPVTTLIASRIGPTFALATTTILFAIGLAIPAGVLAAAHAGRLLDRALIGASVLGFSFPLFWTGYLLVLLFAVHWRILPVQGYQSPGDSVGGFATHMVLPTVTLGLAYTALLARMTRAAMIEALGQDFIRTARAKGLSPTRILFVHALKSAAVPIVTTIGLGLATLLGGTVVTETIFAIPGLGRLAVDSIQTHDFPVIQGLILFFACIYILLNLLIDFSYLLLDPRLRR